MRLTRIAGAALIGVLLLLSIACSSPKYHLSTSINGQGSVMPASGDYLKDSSVVLLANPGSGWKFDHWEGALGGNNSLTTIIMNSDKTVVAYFVEDNTSSPSNVSRGYSITFPAGWEEMSYDAIEKFTSYVSYSACSGGGAMVTIAEMETTGVSLDTFHQISKTVAEDSEGYIFLSEEEITIGDMPAMEMTYTNVIDGSALKTMQCVLINENMGWLMTLSCEPECWDDLESDFEAILDSFQVLE